MKKRLPELVRDFDQAPADGLSRFPREPHMVIHGLRSRSASMIRGLLRIYNHFEINGDQNLRTNRSLVMVANHCNDIDTLCLLAALPPRKLHHRGTDKADLCAIASELRDAVNRLRAANGSN
jgi:1-acyl-sn-glycerol-3-phosphate acyltransferase